MTGKAKGRLFAVFSIVLAFAVMVAFSALIDFAHPVPVSVTWLLGGAALLWALVLWASLRDWGKQ